MPLGRTRADRVVERALAPRAVDDDVVLVGERQPGTQPLTGLALGRMPCREVDVGPVGARDGCHREPDAPAADHEHPSAVPIVVVQPRGVRGVDGDRDRLDERADLDGHHVGERHEAAAVHDHLVGEPAVDGDAVGALGAEAAQVVATREAQVALPARGERLHRDRGAVVEQTCELVAERRRQAPGEEMEVGTADPGRAHGHPHRVA